MSASVLRIWSLGHLKAPASSLNGRGPIRQRNGDRGFIWKPNQGNVLKETESSSMSNVSTSSRIRTETDHQFPKKEVVW